MENKENNNSITFPLKIQNIRIFVIEYSLIVENTVSSVLGALLGIEWEKSKSFGYKNMSLSFSQRINLIQDLKSVDKLGKTKFQFLMTIRNKFAHVSEINSFESFFNVLGKDVNSLKNKLRDWYGPSKIEDSINQEYCKYFFYLFCDCMEILIDLHKDHAYHIGLEEGKSETRQLILKLLIEELKEMENGTEIFAKIESIIRRK